MLLPVKAVVVEREKAKKKKKNVEVAVRRKDSEVENGMLCGRPRARCISLFFFVLFFVKAFSWKLISGE